MLHPSENNSTSCLLSTAVCSKLQHWFIVFCIVVLVPILNRSCHSAVAPTVPDIVTLIVNTLQFFPFHASEINTEINYRNNQT